MDDALLFQLVQQADDRAFSVFYDRYVNLVFSIALTILNEHASAEEVVQDVFLNIWKKKHTYQPAKSKLNTWLSAITRNRSIDELRKKKAGSETKQVALVEVAELQNPADESPEGWVQLQMDQTRVRKALGQLPQDQRQVIFMAYFQGLTQGQIANQLDQPLGTIKTRIRLGMQKLRGLLVESHQVNPK